MANQGTSGSPMFFLLSWTVHVCCSTLFDPRGIYYYTVNKNNIHEDNECR